MIDMFSPYSLHVATISLLLLPSFRKFIHSFFFISFRFFFGISYVDNDGWIPACDKTPKTSSRAPLNSIAESLVHLPDVNAHISDSAELIQKSLSRESNFRV
jgi:hypothetical protein